MMRRLVFCLFSMGVLFLSSCSDSEEESGNGELGFDEFYPRYNAYIKKWLKGEVERVEGKIVDTKKSLDGASDEVEQKKEGNLIGLFIHSLLRLGPLVRMLTERSGVSFMIM